MLENLKTLVMAQAREKSFGITPADVIVSEKMLGIATEIAEAEEIIEEVRQEQEAVRLWCRNYDTVHDGKIAMSWLLINSMFDTSPDRSHLLHYESEWGDVLQRTLHLGGIFEVHFPDDYLRVPARGTHERAEKAYNLAMTASQHYRKKRIPEFSNGLIEISHYCVGVAKADNFNIERVVLDKIEANKTRVWNPNDLNEQLI